MNGQQNPQQKREYELVRTHEPPQLDLDKADWTKAKKIIFKLLSSLIFLVVFDRLSY
jgi:hypothetical protein